MKKLRMLPYFMAALFMLVGCGDNTSEPSSTTNSSDSKSKEENTTKENESTRTDEEEESAIDKVDDLSTGDDKETLSPYTSEQMEYARVWLQLGPNQNLEELNVWHISAGEPLNPDDETSATYPEDVIQLAGARLVDGSVTYSSNGDGTINVYNVPLRWDGNYPAGEEFYMDILKNTKLVYVNPGDDENIIKLIRLLNDHK
jgi:hypothetical protein